MKSEAIFVEMLNMYQPTRARRLLSHMITSIPLPSFFRCNICGRTTATLLRWEIYRDFPACRHCGSTSRVRQIVDTLSREFFNRSIPLPHFPTRKDIVGCGLSDNTVYADALANHFEYSNTFYHQSPFLDITAVPDEWVGKFDFVIASDVFEHITFPVDRAFSGLRALLKPTGFAVFSVPYLPISETDERYPELHDFHIDHDEKGPVLINTTRDGRRQEFRNLVFHGGDGQVLEMRLFSEQDLPVRFAKAGFTATHLPKYMPRFGILDFAAHSHLFILRPDNQGQPELPLR